MSLTDPVPSASSFQYQASWLTGGVVSVTVQPPYTVYIAVQASSTSRCNFTVLVSAYNTTAQQTTPIPLSSAQPLASAIAGGEYRYFTYTVAAGTALTTVALTETYGQSWLLLNSPNATQLPTLSSYQYASSSATFPLVALLQPAAGVWSVGVWSSQSSAFSIIAADSTDTQSMEQGVTYPGYVQRGNYSFYSVYVDALQLAANSGGYLDLELYTVSGDADLYCSFVTMRPSTANNQWSSTWYTAEDSIVIHSSQLRAGTLYCGVNGWSQSTYTFSASFGSGSTLTAGDTVTAESSAGGSQLYSLVFPASEGIVTLSVVCDVGTAQLYITPYGQVPTLSNSLVTTYPATSLQQQLYSTLLCGVNTSLAIPGSALHSARCR